MSRPVTPPVDTASELCACAHPAPQDPQRRHWLRAGLGLAGAGLLSLAGCGGAEDESSSGSTYLRVLNASVDDASADFYVGSTRKFAAVANAGTTTGYEAISAGSNQVSLRTAGSSTTKLSETRNYTEDTCNTLVALGSLSVGLSFKHLAEFNGQPDAGNIKLRVLHASAMLDGLSVYLTACGTTSCPDTALSTANFTLASLGTLSDFALFSSSKAWRIRITPSGSPDTVLYDFAAGAAFADRTVVTLVIVPRTSGSRPEVMALPEQLTAVPLANSLA